MSKETKELIDELIKVDKRRNEVAGKVNETNKWFGNLIKAKKKLNDWKEKLIEEISESGHGDLLTDDIKSKLEEIKEIEQAIEQYGNEDIP